MIEPSHKIRVANVILSFDVGGIERMTLDLCANLDREIFEPTIFCISAGGTLVEEANHRNVSVKILGKHHREFPGIYFALRRLFKQIRPDVIHANPGKLERWFSRSGIPVISTYHNMLSTRGALSIKFEKHLAKLSHTNIGISNAVARNTERRLELSQNSVKTIYNGIDIDRIETLSQMQSSFESSGDPTIAFLGRFYDVKGGDVLLRSWHNVLEQYPDASLIFIGDGPKRESWHKIAEPFADSVKFFGSQENPYPIINNADLLVVPSKGGGFELVVLEAMALGTPVVASAAGGIPEVAGDAASLFESENMEDCSDKIIEMISNDNLRESYIDRGYQRVKQFSIMETVKQYETVYKQAAGFQK